MEYKSKRYSAFHDAVTLVLKVSDATLASDKCEIKKRFLTVDR